MTDKGFTDNPTHPEQCPRRIQMHRTKDWRKPESAVYVGRPSRWGNPWPLTAVLFGAPNGWPLLSMTPALAVELYRTALIQDRLRVSVHDVVAELAGRDLACWCPSVQPCHADVLLKVANPDPIEALPCDPRDLLSPDEQERLQTDLIEMARLRRRAESESQWLPMA